MKKIDELKFVRVIDPAIFQVIPRYLFEQIKGFEPENILNIYHYCLSILMVPIIGNDGTIIRIPNPAARIIVVHNERHEIKGFLWAEIDLIEKHIYVQMLSIDKEYQSLNGEVEKRMVEYLYSIPNEPDIKHLNIKKKIIMATKHPKAFEKYGWRKSESILMEIEENETKNNS